MTTATIEPADVSAAQSTNPTKTPLQQRMEALLLAGGRGEPIDPQERRDLCFELGWSRKVFERHLRDAIQRNALPKEHEQRRRKVEKLRELEAGRDAVHQKCNAKIADILRQAEAAREKAHEELREYDRQHGAEIEQLRAAERDSTQWEAEYHKTMQRTADRRIKLRIGELNVQLLELDTERAACAEQLKEKRQHIDEIEGTSMGPRLVSRTNVDRQWWQNQLDIAKAMLDDPATAPVPRRKYERQLHAAGHRLNEIDRATQRMAAIDAKAASIHKLIAELQEFFYRPECLQIDFHTAE